MIKKYLANAGLVMVSIIVSLSLVEATLRLAYPKYQLAAESSYENDSALIWSPRANRQDEVLHPDSGEPHLVTYNSMALRQSREFGDLSASTNLAFFGDSFTANLGLPAQYMFTEPLDFLLNVDGSEHFNVLNFGVNGYGTSQEYLYYEQFEQRELLDHVFYVLCTNDLRNIYETNLFSLDENGELTRTVLPEPSWWIRLLSRLHTTYLVQDLRQRILYSREDGWQDFGARLHQIEIRSEHEDRFHEEEADDVEYSFRQQRENENLQLSVDIFLKLLKQWSNLVESNGGQFHVVLLPREREQLFLPLLGSEFSVIDLYKLIDNDIENYNWLDIRFKNDGHWSEEGNRLAARYLYLSLAEKLGLPGMDDSDVSKTLAKYYLSFPDGWLPDGQQHVMSTSDAESTKIRNKYIPLDLAWSQK